MSEIKWEPAIQLEDPETITLSRHDNLTGLVELDAVKNAYWKRCVTGIDPVTGQPYVRFVANSPFMAESRGNTHRAMPIWAPESVDEDFNLVLSLCTDGLHRPLTDHDMTELVSPTLRKNPKHQFCCSIVPSTSNWHVYWHHGTSFDEAFEMAGNGDYKKNVMRAGFASLRPPWVIKSWEEPSFYRSEFHGFEESDWLPSVPKDDGKIGWEELFGEE